MAVLFSVREIAEAAVEKEKDAILYFTEFLPYLAEGDRKVVAGLIEEEKGHIRNLSALKRRMGE